MLSRIEHAPVPKNYFQMLTRALRNARLCGPCLTVGLGRVDHPDMISEVADLLLRHQDTAWVLCYGEFESRLLLSLRTTDTQADSGQIMRRVAGRRGTGGGHRTLAGGQIPISGLSREEIARQEKDLVTRFLQQVGAGKCVPELFLS
jgi:nanoRNase/pAp phosphatase (c-di-AMP/oligoRNAs hydrolase)